MRRLHAGTGPTRAMTRSGLLSRIAISLHRHLAGGCSARRHRVGPPARRWALLALATTLLAGCVSVRVGSSDAPGMTYHVLVDARAMTSRATTGAGSARLAIQPISGDPLADSTVLVFSRRAGERAMYQFASWSERPSRRISQLAEQRLEARGRFASVTQLGQPVHTDWLLTLALENMVHDVSRTPGQVQISMRAELIRRADRIRVGQRVFAASSPATEAAAPAAVAAFAVATADLLDQLADWVEATVAANSKP